jgi:hypothetical protein
MLCIWATPALRKGKPWVDPRPWSDFAARWCWCRLYTPVIEAGKIVWKRANGEA